MNDYDALIVLGWLTATASPETVKSARRMAERLMTFDERIARLTRLIRNRR